VDRITDGWDSGRIGPAGYWVTMGKMGMHGKNMLVEGSFPFMHQHIFPCIPIFPIPSTDAATHRADPPQHKLSSPHQAPVNKIKDILCFR